MVPSRDDERRVRSPENVTIRRAVAGDGASLVRLAQLDSKRLPSGSFLMAEVDGQPWAAIELETGEVLADPFHPTADLAEMLWLRAARIRAVEQPGLAPKRGFRGITAGAARALSGRRRRVPAELRP
jgi:hypothetical protein